MHSNFFRTKNLIRIKEIKTLWLSLSEVWNKETYGNSEKDCIGNGGVVITHDNENNIWRVHVRNQNLEWNNNSSNHQQVERERDLSREGLSSSVQPILWSSSKRYLVTTRPFQNNDQKKKLKELLHCSMLHFYPQKSFQF